MSVNVSRCLKFDIYSHTLPNSFSVAHEDEFLAWIVWCPTPKLLTRSSPNVFPQTLHCIWTANKLRVESNAHITLVPTTEIYLTSVTCDRIQLSPSYLRCPPLCLFRTTRIMDSTDGFVSDTSSVTETQFSMSELLGRHRRLLLYGGTTRASSIWPMTSYIITNLSIYTGTIPLSHPLLWRFGCLQDAPLANWKACFAIPAVCYQTLTTQQSMRNTIYTGFLHTCTSRDFCRYELHEWIESTKSYTFAHYICYAWNKTSNLPLLDELYPATDRFSHSYTMIVSKQEKSNRTDILNSPSMLSTRKLYAQK